MSDFIAQASILINQIDPGFVTVFVGLLAIFLTNIGKIFHTNGLRVFLVVCTILAALWVFAVPYYGILNEVLSFGLKLLQVACFASGGYRLYNKFFVEKKPEVSIQTNVPGITVTSEVPGLTTDTKDTTTVGGVSKEEVIISES